MYLFSFASPYFHETEYTKMRNTNIFWIVTFHYKMQGATNFAYRQALAPSPNIFLMGISSSPLAPFVCLQNGTQKILNFALTSHSSSYIDH